uniref:Uncharacterized protein n=1 Tax=Ursus maritimus TaxID=29073 RepID=A0A452TM01_URSMA
PSASLHLLRRLALPSSSHRTGPRVTRTAHTGQVQDEDYRKTRFVGRQKDVNENFAIGLIAEQPLTEAESPEVVCDSSGVALGPPEVYINRDKEAKTGTCAPGDCRCQS